MWGWGPESKRGERVKHFTRFSTLQIIASSNFKLLQASRHNLPNHYRVHCCRVESNPTRISDRSAILTARMSDFEDEMDVDSAPSKDITFSAEAGKGKRSAANLPVEAEDNLPWCVTTPACLAAVLGPQLLYVSDSPQG